MLKRIIDNFGYLGSLALFAGLVAYSLDSAWSLWSRIGVYGGLALLLVYTAFHVDSISEALRSRGARRGGAAGASVLLLLGILALVNFLNFRHHQRLDLSEGGVHSLSEQSRQIVENLQTDLKLIGFFVDPSEAEDFENLMKEYRFASSRVEYEVVDPQQDVAKVSQYDIDRSGQIVIAAGEKTQKIDRRSEEDITNAIIKVTRDVEKVVYFLEGHKERDLAGSEEDGYQSVRQAIEKQNYKVESYNLAAEGKLPEDVTVLVAAGPETNFLPHEVQALQGFLENGGKFLLMVDPQTDFHMNDLFSQYGFRFREDAVIDVTGLGQLLGLGPAAPLVSSYSSHPLTSKLEATTFFPLAQSLEKLDSPMGYEVQELFSSGSRSWGETRLSAGEEVNFDEGQDTEGPLILGLVATKTNDEKAAPEGEGAASGEEAEAGSPEPQEQGSSSSKKETRIIAVGDSDFASNRFLGVGGGNMDLFLNMVSWLAEDTDLVAIRPKDPTSRQVTLTQRDSRVLFWGTVILLPLATLILGVSVWMRRR